MKIFSWMQNKLNAKQVTKRPNTGACSNHMPQATLKEEFSDWPQALLAIGTFGISDLKDDQNHPQTTRPEEVGELQEELNSESESETQDPPSEPVCEDFLNKEIRLQRNLSGVFSRGKEIFVDNQQNVIKKKSLTFLLKKFFTSRRKFGHSLPDQTMDKSRMEKVLRAILNKKIHPQANTSKAMPKKYLEAKDSDEEMFEDEDDNDGSTWVKTDSEYIVLEI